MPKCPECGEEIDSLIYAYEVQIEGDLCLDDDGNLEYRDTTTNAGVGSKYEYSCPKCNAPLFYEEEHAFRFLDGER